MSIKALEYLLRCVPIPFLGGQEGVEYSYDPQQCNVKLFHAINDNDAVWLVRGQARAVIEGKIVLFFPCPQPYI